MIVIATFVLILGVVTSFSLWKECTSDLNQKSFENLTNSVVTEIKNSKDNKIIGETDDALYYLGVQDFMLYKYDKREAYTKTFSFEDMGMYSGVHTMVLDDGMIVLIGGNGALGNFAGSIAAFFDIPN